MSNYRQMIKDGIPISGEAVDAMSFPTPRPSDLMQQQPSFFDKGIMNLKEYGSQAGDFLFGSEASKSDILARAGELQTEAAAQNLTLSGKQAIEMAEKELAPSFLRKYGPSAALGIASLTAGGAFETPEQEEIVDLETGYDVFQRDPNKYLVGGIPSAASTRVSPRTRFPFEYTPYTLPGFSVQNVADGGEIFPRRNGGISPREGTPGKDSVRAMLMPGEFVMTTDAVKGLGGGNLDKGIKNMYNVMSKLEKRGKAMA